MSGGQHAVPATVSPETQPQWVASRERGSLYMMRLMSALSLRLGRPAGRVVLHVIATYFLLFAPRVRPHMRAYLRRALGREPRIADLYRLILSFATTIHDRVYLLRDRLEKMAITIEGEQLLVERCARGEVAFLMGAHFGSFEVLRALGRSQPGVRVAMAMYGQNAQKVSRVLEALDPQLSIDIIALGSLDSILQLRTRLDAGTFVGMLGDRSIKDEQYECIDFLGAPAWFPTAAMRVAALLRKPVLFMAGVYRGGNQYHLLFEELADFSHTTREQREASVRQAVRRYAAVLERLCRSDPYNWFNFFDFWQVPAAVRVEAGST